MSYLVPRLRTPQQSYGPPVGVKKGRKCDLATDLTYQRRYKSNKRKYSVAQTTWKYLALFWGVVRGSEGRLTVARGLRCESGGQTAADRGDYGDGGVGVDGTGQATGVADG